MEEILYRSAAFAERLYGYLIRICRLLFDWVKPIEIKAQSVFYIQYFFGRCFSFIAAPLMPVVMKLLRYRVRDMAHIRQTVRHLLKKHKGPWIICANHLTMIDSLILAWAMMPAYRYMLNYRWAPWNVPERNNFHRNIIVGWLCYLTKCIPITRRGKRKTVRSTLDKCALVLRKKQNLMIFPEGGRSRTGRIDIENFQYGVGRLVNQNPDCRVMCIYLRGDQQNDYSNFPRFGEVFYMTVDVCSPTSMFNGLKAHRDCAQQIIVRLAQMEKNYFDSCGK
jgi:1-acyl-sn-glycerol-3-phosphate acyltransferase